MNYLIACLTWTKYPDSVTPVWNGKTVTLKWDYNLTTEEQNAAKIAINRAWLRGNESHLESIASKIFISGQSVAYVEDFKPHITISRSEEATLIINEVAKEDKGLYKFRVGFLILGGRLISRNLSLEVRGKITVKRLDRDQNTAPFPRVTDEYIGVTSNFIKIPTRLVQHETYIGNI